MIRDGQCVCSSKVDGWEIFRPKFIPFPKPEIMAISTLLKDGVFSLTVDTIYPKNRPSSILTFSSFARAVELSCRKQGSDE